MMRWAIRGRFTATLAALLAAWGLAGCGGNGANSGAAASPAYAVKVTVTGLDGSGLVLQNNGGDDLSVSADGTATFSNRLASGALYAVTVKSQPTMLAQRCTLANSSGSIGSSDVTSITLTCQSLATPYLYVANAAANKVAAFGVNATTGGLTAIDLRSEVTLVSPTGLAVDPEGRYLYVANAGITNGTAAISTFAISSAPGSEGTLSPLGTTDTAGNPTGIAVSADGKHVYAAGTSGLNGQLRGFSLQSGGTLAALGGGTYSAGSTPRGVAVDPLGRFVYVANNGSGTISVFTRNASSGALTAGVSALAGSQPQSLAIDPGGRWLYAVNAGSQELTTYRIDGTNGTLTQVQAKALAHAPYDLAVHPRGTHVYAVFNSSDLVATYRIDASTGALTEVSSSLRSTGQEPTAIRIDGTGSYLYIANKTSNTLSIFSIARDTGLLSLVGSPSGGTGTAPAGLALVIR